MTSRPPSDEEHVHLSSESVSSELEGGGMQARETRIRVNHEFASAADFVDQYVSDISTSGVFLRCEDVVDIGTKVSLHFTILADEIETIEGIGEVVRIQENPPGVGIEFRSLSEESMQLIEELVAGKVRG